MSKNTFFSSFGKRSVLFPMLGDSFDGKKNYCSFLQVQTKYLNELRLSKQIFNIKMFR